MAGSEYLKGVLLTGAGVMVLSFDALLIRLIQADSFDLLFWRGLLMTLAISLWCHFRVSDQPLFSSDKTYLSSALFYTGSTICFVWAINNTSVANVLIILSAQPLFAALLARFWLKESTPVITWIAIFLSILAIGWVFSGSLNSGHLVGDMIALLAGLSLSAKFVNDRAVEGRNMTPALATAGIFVAVFSLLFGDPMALQGSDWGWMLLHSLVVIPVAFILITIGPMRISAAEVCLLMLLETVFGPLWVWLVLAEIPQKEAFQGGAVIITVLLIHALIQYRSNRAD